MFLSLGYILLCGFLIGRLYEAMGVPRLVGMLCVGIVLGPFGLNLLDDSILALSSDIRKMALIIILLKAGFSLTGKDVKKVGRPALLLSFLPAVFELIAYTLLAPLFFEVNYMEAALIGSVLAAVSPAVVVPRMVGFIEQRLGTKEGIPQMILAGATLDDTVVLVLFATLLQMNQGIEVKFHTVLLIPLTILSGILIGFILGKVLSTAFMYLSKKQDDVIKGILFIALSFVLVGIEKLDLFPFSSLLAILSMAMVYKEEVTIEEGNRLSSLCSSIWVMAEILLFVLVGAEVNITYSLNYGWSIVLLIIFALMIRSIGTWLTMLYTPLSLTERIFTIIAYLPKATVQAAIGSVPLAQGLPSGELILTVAVMGILLTAPIGAIGIDFTSKRWLTKE